MTGLSISATEGGPFLVRDRPVIRSAGYVTSELGEPMTWRFGEAFDLTIDDDEAVTARSRCGHRSDKPFCDGSHAEVRNRMMLCRCGAPSNKPLCDGSHRDVGFEGSA